MVFVIVGWFDPVADPQVIAFAAIAALLTMTPGADTMLVIRNVLLRGRRDGLLTTVGICCGLFVHASLSALGLSVVLVRSAAMFEVVKLAGAIYLGWLGLQSVRRALRARHDLDSASGDVTAAAAGGWRSLTEGVVSNILNPKVAVFYLAFLPQFLTPGDWVLGKSMVLAAIHWVEGMLWLSLISLFVGRIRRLLRQPRVTRAIELTTGGVLILFGAKLALERARP